MRRLAWGLVLGLLLAAPAWAGVGVWTPMGGVEPPFGRLLVDPVHPQTIYALASMTDPERAAALWKSTDGGETWKSSQEGLGVPLDLLAIDPLHPERLYGWQTIQYPYTPTPRLWVSEDGGVTWTQGFTVSPSQDGPYFWQLVPSPIQAGVLYAWEDNFTGAPGSGAALIYRSTDGGATFERRGAVGGSRSAIETLSHHPTRNVLEFFDNDAFYTSVDGGLTWSVRGTYRGRGFRDVARSIAAPDRLYGLPSDPSIQCLARSDDAGATWNRIGPPALRPGMFCSDIAVDPRNPDLLRVLARGQVDERFVTQLFTSRDGGATWSRPASFPASDFFFASTLVTTAAGAETLFAAGTYTAESPGPYKSTDGGQTWTPSWDGIASGDLRTGFVALPGPGRSPLLFTLAQALGFGAAPLMRSTNFGVTWEPLAPLVEYHALTADAGGQILYAERGIGRLLRSADAGVTWVDVTPAIQLSLGTLIADPNRSGRVFFTQNEFSGPSRVTLWRTADAGASWVRRSAGLPTLCSHFASVDYCPDLRAVTSDPRNPDRVLIAFGGSQLFDSVVPVYLSTNGGRSWQLVAQSPPGTVLSLAADPGAPGVFLAGTATGVYRSTDVGEHWTAVTPGLPVAAPVLQLLRDPRTGSWYAVTDAKGIFRSTDGGNSWSDISAGLPDLAAPRTVLDPKVRDRLFTAVRGQGVWSWRAPAG